MTILQRAQTYIDSQPEPKRTELQWLHDSIRQTWPEHELWFLDGKNEAGKVVSNPNIGYGRYTIAYANGSTKEFFRVGLSANTNGISVYVMGLPDKAYLAKAIGERIGKANVTGYCIKFKSLKDIDVDVLLEAIRIGFDVSSSNG